MSLLQVDDNSRRGRSRSPSGRQVYVDERGCDRDLDRDLDRDFDRSHSRSRSRAPAHVVDAVPYPEGVSGSNGSAAYEFDRLTRYRAASPPDEQQYYGQRGSRERVDEVDVRIRYSDGRREKEYHYEKERERERPDSFRFLPPKYAQTLEAGVERLLDRSRDRTRNKDDGLAYGSASFLRPESSSLGGTGHSYSYDQPEPWEYAKKVEDKRYSSTESLGHRRESSFGHGARGSDVSLLTVEPGAAPRKSAMKRDRSRSPQPPVARMSSLSVQTTGLPTSTSLSAAPGSPLLESYHGTYQSMSPMPSPLLLASSAGPGLAGLGPEMLEALSAAGSDDEPGDRRRPRRARFHDPIDDAARLANALKGDKRAPDTGPLVELLPGMTHEQVMELRTEYKRLVKTGAERKGVNLAKHIRARLKDEDASLMKACYATALGRWESEAYWANFWYQGDKTRRELLIEALMGRTNDEIAAIKDAFHDSKYGGSLTRCMKTELKEDKFKKAVLLVLDEQRMDDVDVQGRPARIDNDLVASDARELHHCVRGEKGGETAMINIVVLRSDTHLREVMARYSQNYHSNFAKDALKKSGNLVGELLVHILNGVINRPVRDAMLLQHALGLSKKDGLRRELLISRLVRYHWDVRHMAAIKLAYRERYDCDLQDAVRTGTTGEWGAFCQALCISRMPDEVKRLEGL